MSSYKTSKLSFYRALEFEKDFFKMLVWYQKLKNKMLKDEKAPYCNGKVYNN